jgi:hypothetical protein
MIGEKGKEEEYNYMVPTIDICSTARGKAYYGMVTSTSLKLLKMIPESRNKSVLEI